MDNGELAGKVAGVLEELLKDLAQDVAALRARVDSLGRTVVSLIQGQLELKSRLDALEGKPSVEQRRLFANRKWKFNRSTNEE